MNTHLQSQMPDIHSQDARQKLTSLLMTLFARWNLPDKDKLMLLGMDETSRTALSRYEKNGAVDNRVDTLNRAAMLLEIHALLEIIFPDNENYIFGWMTARHTDFNNLRPVDVARKHAYLGLSMLVRYLEKIRGE